MEASDDGYPLIETFYERVVLARPWASLALILVLAAIPFAYIPDFEIDASGDTLVMQRDAAYRYFRKISERYGGRPAVIVTYRPENDLLSPPSLDRLRDLHAELRKIDGVASVLSILDVPLLKNPPGSLRTLDERIKTLRHPDADRELARRELSTSPLYSNALVSPDLSATAIQVSFKENERYESLTNRRFELRQKAYSKQGRTGEQRRELRKVSAAYERLKTEVRTTRDRQIRAIREVLDRHRTGAEVGLGGIPVIVDQIISYIQYDLRVFGVGIMLMLTGMLWLMLRRLRWVVFPMLTCLFSGLVMVGGLGFLGWEVTVVSSNFISLQLIFTMALVIHVVVRYCEELGSKDDTGHRSLIARACAKAFVPCLYAVLTTSAGFSSLLVSNLKPVVTFGWIMIVGVNVSLLVTFLVLPVGLGLLSRPSYEPDPYKAAELTAFFGRLTERYRYAILAGGVLVVGTTAYGVTLLKVENRFVDYFRESTEVYKSLRFIDRNLGGTSPLDLIVNFDESEGAKPDSTGQDETAGEFGEFGGYAEETAAEKDTYWYTASKMDTLERVHDYLDKQEETGKVRSLATLWKVGRDLLGRTPDTLELQILMKGLPDSFRRSVVDEFVSVDHDQARIRTRIKDSLPSLNRNQFLKRVRSDLVEQGVLKRDQFRLTGFMVLYNDMLQSLYRSQVRTIVLTVVLIFVILFLLFRSLTVTLIALVPNLISATAILGIMGLAGIPLDLMTMTIVAISVGIALDDTIHYLHRFEKELRQTGDYLEAMHRCHGTIGNALTYTTMAIVTGFMILVMSKFVPTILFGVLTSLAMVIALLSALTLLPSMILLVRPYDTGDTG